MVREDHPKQGLTEVTTRLHGKSFAGQGMGGDSKIAELGYGKSP